MATLSEQFKKTLSNIEPESNDVKNAISAHEEVRKVLNQDSVLSKWGVDPILIGSYARDVTIRRVKDVDLFGRLTSAPEDLRPGEALDEFGRALTQAFNDRVEAQHRSFKVDFPDLGLAVDVVPARKKEDCWQIPSRPEERAKWIETNPIKFAQITTEINHDERFQLSGTGVYVPTVKLIRQIVKANLAEGAPGGFFFEVMTFWVFRRLMNSQLTYANYLSASLQGIAELFEEVLDSGLPDPTLDEKTIITKADAESQKRAAEKLSDLASLSTKAILEEDICRSALMWEKILGSNESGEVFDTPEQCKSAKSPFTSSVNLRTPGAPKVPAGTGRYAR